MPPAQEEELRQEAGGKASTSVNAGRGGLKYTGVTDSEVLAAVLVFGSQANVF